MRKILCALAILATGMGIGQLANAEYLGLPNGRSADLSRMSDLSVEGAFITGDIDFGDGVDGDYDNIGVRVNYRVSPGFMVFGDFGKADIESIDDTGYGAGVYYQLQDLIPSKFASVKLSYHQTKFSETRRTLEFKSNVLAVDLLISGQDPISPNGMDWYANVGVHRLSAKVSGFAKDNETELAFGGGITLPVGPGLAYFGAEHVGELTFGVGFRYNVY